jgi:hypothetical protein
MTSTHDLVIRGGNIADGKAWLSKRNFDVDIRAQGLH